jgi:ATP-dependent RNA helicase SUPV3L1/SUV3
LRSFPEVTGEEQLLDEGAGNAASTIEMLNPDDPCEVAVIDEVQMIGDASRTIYRRTAGDNHD